MTEQTTNRGYRIASLKEKAASHIDFDPDRGIVYESIFVREFTNAGHDFGMLLDCVSDNLIEYHDDGKPIGLIGWSRVWSDYNQALIARLKVGEP